MVTQLQKKSMRKAFGDVYPLGISLDKRALFIYEKIE
jgi:hypothetical protein